MRVKGAVHTSDELLAFWKEAARARRLGLSAWIRSVIAEYLERPMELPPEEETPRQSLWIDFWWSEGDRAAAQEFARENGYGSLSELLRRILAAAAENVLARRQVEV